MRAAWYDRVGDPREVLTVGELPDPDPGHGEVRVRVAMSGVNPSDGKHRAGWNGMRMAHPRIVPHQDGAGVIDRVGSGVDPARIGERVWLYEAAANGRAFGTAAELVVIPSSHAVPLPESVDFAHGACLGVPALTAHRALFWDGPIAGMTILVAGGAGSVGRCAVQLARWAGADVIATAGSSQQCQIALMAGARAVVPYAEPACVERLGDLAPSGFDRVVEVALLRNAAADVALLRPGGVIAAFVSGDDAGELIIPSRAMLAKGLTLRWVHVYSMPDAAKAQAVADITIALADGALTPPPMRSLPLERIAEAHEIVGVGGFGSKMVISID